MKRILSVLAVIVGLIIVIGLSIWVGFPSPPGFNRTAICYVGYLIGIALVVFGVAMIAMSYDV